MVVHLPENHAESAAVEVGEDADVGLLHKVENGHDDGDDPEREQQRPLALGVADDERAARKTRVRKHRKNALKAIYIAHERRFEAGAVDERAERDPENHEKQWQRPLLPEKFFGSAAYAERAAPADSPSDE